MMITDGIGLYVHIPFCVRKCNYCDFSSFCGIAEEDRGAYIKALKNEILSYKRTPKIRLATIFFGGGTPSLLSPSEFSDIFSAVSESFDLDYVSEFTIEANPKTLSEEKLLAYVSSGANRISLGLQSIHENETKKLGRIHNLADFEEALALVEKSGIHNINVDLMYGIPYQTKESFSKTLEYVSSLNVPHISVYGLMIEEGTPFYTERESLPLPSEDEEAELYYMASEYLSSLGYRHYEISNYAKPSQESRHNLIYWRAGEYIGVGLSAYSYFESKRYGNTSDLLLYTEEKYAETREYEFIDRREESYEFSMLALRLSEGFSLSEYETRFGSSFLDGREEKIKNYIKGSFIRLDGDRISLTERGFYVSNTILADLL